VADSIKKKHFVSALFNGTIEKDLLQPFPQYTEEEREEMQFILESVRKFSNDKIDAVKIDREHHIPDSVKEGMAELGLWGLIIPEAYGGFEQPEFTYNKVMEILTGVCGSTSVMYGGHLSIGLKAILLYGTEEQKKKFLPELSAGEKLAGFALTEPGAGSDALSIKTNAVLSDDGSHYIINGEKLWITNGGFADLFTVFAKVREPGKDIESSKMTAFIVPRELGGITSGKEEDKLGICGSSTTPLYFDNVKVPVENVLGGVGGGFNIAMGVLTTGRLGLGAGCVGAAKELIKYAIAHAHQRKQFKKNIAEFEMVKEKFARMAVNTFTGESMVYFTTFMKNNLNAEVSVESAICKAFGSEALWQTVNDCLQIAGGNGFMKEYPFERYLRDTRINLIFEGANEILRMMIAVTGLQRPSVVLKKYIKELPEDRTEKARKIQEICDNLIAQNDNNAFEGFSERQQELIDLVKTLTEQLYDRVIKAVLLYGREIREMQYIQKRFADAVIHIYGIIANILRVENLIRTNHSSAENAIVLSRVFARNAQLVVIQNLDDVLLNDDEDLDAVAHMLYEAEKYPFDILEY